MVIRVEDAERSSGLMVALVQGSGEAGVLLQAGTARYVLTPAEARDVASTLAYTAALSEAGDRPQAGVSLPPDPPVEDIARAARKNRRRMPS